MSTMSGADPDLLDELGRELTASAQQLLALQGRLTARVQQAPWQGRDADRVRAQWSARHARAVAGAAGELERAAATVSGNATDQRRASAADGGAIGALGLVGGGVTGTVGAALHGATGAGLTGASAAPFTGAAGAAFTGAAGAVPGTPQPGSTPTAVATWWNGLTPAQREDLIRTQPGVVGNLDGVPVVDRDRANRAYLPQLTAGLQSQLDTLDGQEPPRFVGRGLQSPQWVAWHERRDQLQRQLDGVHVLRDSLAADAAAGVTDRPPLYLIGVQSDGDGRGIVSRGNPDTASHVATLVPGIDSPLAGIPGGITRSDRMYAAAGPGSASTAVITWYAYDSPNSVTQFSDTSAQAGAPLLDSFQDGLRATHQGVPSVNTVVAHSYAANVAAYAASADHPLNADNLVFVAGTGDGPAHSVSDLHLTGVPSDQNGSHVYATIDPHDPVSLFPSLPSDPNFGAHTFGEPPPDDPQFGMFQIAAHSAYWDPGSESLSNLGTVIAGHGGQTH